MNTRLSNIRRRLADQSLDGILISSPDNRRYLSGFTGSAGILFISADISILATDSRYHEQAGNQALEYQVVNHDLKWSWLLDVFSKAAIKSVGIESRNMTVSTYKTLTDVFNNIPRTTRPTLTLTTGLVEGIRATKEPDELPLIQNAIDIADRAMTSVTAQISPGITEREIAWNLEKTMRELGADSPSFDTIVASGPNGAMPHHSPSDRVISDGDPIVIDMGAKVNGYCSDITRTICVGNETSIFRRVYDTVLGAQLAAIASVKVGMTGDQADGFSRAVITEAGYGEHFGHSLGHGIGLAVHEHPNVGPQSAHALEHGMVFTVEPGIYISGWGGVRIEDMVLLGPQGARVLSQSHK